MSSLSVRKLPKELEKALNKEAKRSGKSKSDIVIHALELLLHIGCKQERKDKIHAFFGKMSSKEYQNFCERVSVFSQIDNEMWK